MFTTASRVPVRMQSQEQTGHFPVFFSLTDFLSTFQNYAGFHRVMCRSAFQRFAFTCYRSVYRTRGAKGHGASGRSIWSHAVGRQVQYVLPHASHQSGSKVMGKAAAAQAAKQAAPTSPVQLHHRLFVQCSLIFLVKLYHATEKM